MAAVAVCLIADVIGVATAANMDDEGGGSTAAPVAVTGSAAPAPPAVPSSSAAAPVDVEETVPATRPSAPSAAAPRPPAAPTVVERGSGSFAVVAAPADAIKVVPATGRIVRYTLETEGGLGVDPAGFARTVVANLTDPRGWQTRDAVKFVNVSPAEAAAGTRPDLRIVLASPDTTDRLCAPLKTRGKVSCHNGGRVVLNARRWLLGADAYGADVTAYRIYLVNHEVGHGIGHGHVQCPGRGRPAPVMMQQTYGLDGCTPWTWPTAKPA